MLLYHGSNVEIQKPDLKMSRKYLDFGAGFYLTSNNEQAIQFAGKVVLRAMKMSKKLFNQYALKTFDAINRLQFVKSHTY